MKPNLTKTPADTADKYLAGFTNIDEINIYIYVCVYVCSSPQWRPTFRTDILKPGILCDMSMSVQSFCAVLSPNQLIVQRVCKLRTNAKTLPPFGKTQIMGTRVWSTNKARRGLSTAKNRSAMRIALHFQDPLIGYIAEKQCLMLSDDTNL